MDWTQIITAFSGICQIYNILEKEKWINLNSARICFSHTPYPPRRWSATKKDIGHYMNGYHYHRQHLHLCSSFSFQKLQSSNASWSTSTLQFHPTSRTERLALDQTNSVRIGRGLLQNKCRIEKNAGCDYSNMSVQLIPYIGNEGCPRKDEWDWK